MLPMTGFEPRTTGVGSDHSTNCATTTALSVDFPYKVYIFSLTKITDSTYPTISFCLGFKEVSDVSKIMTVKNIQNWKQNQTLKTMNETFRRVTFDLKDILVNITAGKDGDFERDIFVYNVTQSRQDAMSTEVLEIYSDQGRCYSFYNKGSDGNTEATVKFVMNISSYKYPFPLINIKGPYV